MHGIDILDGMEIGHGMEIWMVWKLAIVVTKNNVNANNPNALY